MTDNTAKNIKALRNAYGETQLELAFAIGLDSPSAISQYENGTRIPQTRERQRLAEHFRITEDELAHADFSRYTVPSISGDVREKASGFLDGLLPIISTEKAMADPQFKKGYEAHLRICESIKAGKPVNERTAESCIDAYLDALYDNHVSEAAANLLWWLVVEGIEANYGETSDGVKKLRQKKISTQEFYKNHFLISCDGESAQQRENSRAEFLEENGEDCIDLLKKLKACPYLSELADYYSALMYTYGMIDNGLTLEMNQSIGYEMLRAAARLGNKYAKRAVKAAQWL